MHEPLYRQAVRHSWQLIWQHKSLWIFGLFAALWGQMGLLDLLGKITFSSSDYALYPHWLALPKLLSYLEIGSYSLTFDGWIWFFWLGAIMAGLCILGIFLSTASQGVLVYAAAESFSHKKDVDISSAWQAGIKHFWRLLFLNIFKKSTMVMLAVFVGYGTYNYIAEESVSGFLLFLVIFLLAVLVGLVLSFLVLYAAGYVVVENYPLLRAVESSWRLFTRHWLVSVEVGLLVLFFNAVLVVLLALLFLVLLFPVLLIWFVAALASNLSLFIVGLLISVFIFTLFIIFLGSIFMVFTTSLWMYVFTKMHKEGIASRLLRWAGHI